MVTFLVTSNGPLVSRMVPETPVASIASKSLAAASAARSEPGPLSLVLVTVIVVARAAIVIAKNSAMAIGAAGQARALWLREYLSEGRVFILPSQCGKRRVKTDISSTKTLLLTRDGYTWLQLTGRLRRTWREAVAECVREFQCRISLRTVTSPRLFRSKRRRLVR